ncbi:hypothetical protein [Frateuria sp. STR12]|uniref:hypothetical protein n=1 Tax=Frateuria hangzhouensis TaxID=2995589 RepID=UPI002260FB43|nr:hypothetical protein [Frateuria sp. STR12]MCX7513617.1 hypothetical protein [Frateuria sp. STR12]
MSEPVIRIVAAVIRGEDGRTLLVRKRGAGVFRQPIATLSREHILPLLALLP